MPRAVVSEVTVPLSVIGAAGLHAAVGGLGLLPQDGDALTHAQPAVADAADGHAPDVVVGGEVGHQQLQGVTGRVTRRRGVLHEQLQQRSQVGPGRAGSSVAVPTRALV